MKRLRLLAKDAPQDTVQDVIGVLALGGMLWALLHLPLFT